MYKSILFLLPFLFFGCSSDSASPANNKHSMLVIRLNFSNQTLIQNEEVWKKKIFGNEIGELNHYYREISSGKFEFNPVLDAGSVQDGITTLNIDASHPNPRTTDPEFEEDLKSKVHPIFKTALLQVSTKGFDFSTYDTNKNGVITPDELIIMFVLAGQEDAYIVNSEKGIWAHEWCTDNDITANGVSLLSCNDGGNYAVFGERHDDHDATIGIIAHELGHVVFQLPDLYYDDSTRIGYYGLMSMGSWGQSSTAEQAGDTPTHMCAWSKIDTGWYSANTISNNTNIDLYASGSDAYNILKVPLPNTNDEYFLLENRGLYGYDAGLNIIDDAVTGYTGGVAIWHIDEAVIRAKRDSNSINSSASHKGVDLEEAAGASVDYGNGDPSQNFYYSGNVNAFTPNTSPNTDSYSGNSNGVSITNISALSEIMTLDITN